MLVSMVDWLGMNGNPRWPFAVDVRYAHDGEQ